MHPLYEKADKVSSRVIGAAIEVEQTKQEICLSILPQEERVSLEAICVKRLNIKRPGL
jgi:hypothetical protein